MRISITKLFFAVVWLVLTCSVSLAQSDPLPAGWLETKDTKKNAIEYSKRGDTSGSIVKIYLPAPLEQHTADEWLREKLTTSKAPKGVWLDDLSITRSSANIALGHRSFQQLDGKLGRLDAFVSTLDQVFVRLGVSIFIPTNNNGSLMKESVAVLSSRMLQYIKQDSTEQKFGSSIEATPSKVSGIQPGGVDIKPGLYVGSYRQKNGKVFGKRSVILYDNGEYEFLHKEVHGTHVYFKGNGRFDMEDEFYNSSYRDKLSIYGIDQQSNEYTIYAEKQGGFGNVVSRLVWSSPPDRLSPSIREEQEKLKEQEERRYKFTTRPGQGIKESDIEAVLYTWELRITGFGTNQFVVEPYLLMKNGRVMDYIPVAPFMLDEAKSRSREPDRWGWWKRKDDKFVFAWTKDKNKFSRPRGTQGIGSPIPAGTKLEGFWQHKGSFSTGAATVVSSRSVTFTKDGRFQTSSSTMTGVDGAQLGGDGYAVGLSSDEGSTSSASVGPVSSGSRSKSNNSEDDRTGSYTFDGYNLTLEYDNGQVVYEFTFAIGDEYKELWFKGGYLKRVE